MLFVLPAIALYRKRKRDMHRHSWIRIIFVYSRQLALLPTRRTTTFFRKMKFLLPRNLYIQVTSPNPRSIKDILISKKLSRVDANSRFFVVREELGRGSRGVVLKVTHVLDNIPLGDYAVKRVPLKVTSILILGGCRRQSRILDSCMSNSGY